MRHLRKTPYMYKIKPPNKNQLFTATLFLLALGLYFLIFGSAFFAHLKMPEALIAPIMALGSFVAGSTFLGGGAVAFPAVTKILHSDPNTAKTFSLAIQSVGMSSASVYILMRVRIIPWRFFYYFLPGMAIGLLLSLVVLDVLITPNDLRISFTLFILVFLLVYLWAFSNKDKHYTDLGPLKLMDKNLIIKAGLLGGVLSGCLGSGADLVGFCILALYFRLDLKLATQTSVILMAITSLLGVVLQGFVFTELDQDVKHLWLLAAPIVIIGAPLGAVFCRRVTTRSLLIFISTIVATEVISTLILVPINLSHTPYYFALTLFSLLLLLGLHRASKRKVHKAQHEFREDDI
ncbi:Uncharacterized membrane protein YfcA [Alteromonadaceae bacterium Bs31]|nr:Uncharacterized membrane protein YfcA [Alteromonadaceae bacterium Bs31]